MSVGALVWVRLATVTALAALLAAVLSPPQPTRRLPVAAATLAGLGAGAALFTAAVRLRRPVRGLGLARPLVLGLCAANEELLWRRVLLGELLAAGPLAALMVSSAGFAIAHRRRRRLHAVTGAGFGAVYLATGFLGASIAAHWLYNALVGTLGERSPP